MNEYIKTKLYARDLGANLPRYAQSVHGSRPPDAIRDAAKTDRYAARYFAVALKENGKRLEYDNKVCCCSCCSSSIAQQILRSPSVIRVCDCLS